MQCSCKSYMIHSIPSISYVYFLRESSCVKVVWWIDQKVRCLTLYVHPMMTFGKLTPLVLFGPRCDGSLKHGLRVFMMHISSSLEIYHCLMFVSKERRLWCGRELGYIVRVPCWRVLKDVQHVDGRALQSHPSNVKTPKHLYI